MLYTTVIIKDKEYKFRLGAKQCVDLENALGTNPLNVLMGIDDRHLPEIETIVTIWHYSLQKFNHGITLADTYEIYDDYIDEGHNIADSINVVIDILKCSGFVPEDKEEKN